jgi:PAS domain S-box-containing protein
MNQHPLDTEIKDWHIQHLPYKIMWMDKDGNIVYANDQFKDLLEYKSSELLKLSVLDINPVVTQESWREHWEEVAKNGSAHFKSVHQTKSGKYYDVEVFAQFFSNNGKSLICATVNDISESRFYRNLLSHSERMTNSGGWKLNLQDGTIIVTDQLFTIFETNDKFDFLPGKIIHRFHESDELREMISKAMRRGVAYDKVLTLQTSDYGVKYIRCMADPVIKRDKIYKLIGTYQDVTEQIKKENSLELFKAVIDNAEDLVYVYNREGALIHYSDSVREQLGFSKEELDRFTIFDLDEQIERDWWYSHFDEIVEKGALRFEWFITRKNKTKFPADITANHIRYNNVDYNCAVIRDITEKKMKDVKLYEALEEIKALKDDLELDNQYLKEEINERVNIDNIICQSEAYREVLEKVTQVAVTDATVLITGESGTGKELLATAVHLNSRRNDRALIKVNCATLPKDLIESELFGHKKGAFTGAIADKVGKFSLADGGTIFLDEIGEIPIDLQSKLLRVLQEGEFDSLGAMKTTKVDVRVIAATNRDLLKMVKEGKFREDLYYRLNVFPIYNIPLRARKEDIPLLADFFLKKYSAKAGKSFKRLSKQTIAALMDYNFPGNIRELENLIERAVIIENGTTLKPGNWLPKTNGTVQKDTLKSLDDMQRDYIVDVLEHTKWRVSGPKGAASILGMKDKTLFARMKKLGIEKQVGLKR